MCVMDNKTDDDGGGVNNDGSENEEDLFNMWRVFF